MEGKETVVYFTHDYFSLAFDKNAILKNTAASAKSVGVKNLVCVLPIEYDFYESETLEGIALVERRKAEEEARKNFPNLTIL